MNLIELQNKGLNKKILPVDFSINEKGELIIGGCNTIELAKTYKTPLYIIDEKTLEHNCFSYINSLKKYYDDFLIIYASKAFTCKAILKIINNCGLGLDVVSGGELHVALETGFKKKNIYFHGNNKSEDEIRLAINNDVGKIVCDNLYELNLIQEISKEIKKTTDILIRVTPGIECHTHEYIKTGHLDSKFGFDLEYLDSTVSYIKSSCKNINLTGLHAHIGSQIFEIKPYEDLIDILFQRFNHIKESYGIELSEINIGGGLGISYTDNDDPFLIEEWAKIISKTIDIQCKKYNFKKPKLICEPGRSIVGNSGITLYKVGNIKEVPNIRKYVAVDGGMADNPRPITYQAKYTAVIANKLKNEDYGEIEKVTIAGRYCESGDILIKDIDLPKVSEGDIIAIFSTGAYNYSMSSNYNMVPRPACVLVKNEKSDLIIERETYQDILSKHIIPDRLK